MTGRLTVHSLDVMKDAGWAFETGQPQWRPSWGYGTTVFDPFPCYSHPVATVTKAAQHVERACPPLWNVNLWIADREEVTRSNGHSFVYENGHYNDDNKYVKDEPIGLILLGGKRIPPHPGMTHYLVGHEYGHNIHYMLNTLYGSSTHDDEPLRRYLQIRGLPPEQHLHHGAGGNWHSSGHEIFACDFRILVCKVETDFWPHEGIPYPDSPALDEWWAEAVFDLGVARTQRSLDNP